MCKKNPAQAIYFPEPRLPREDTAARNLASAHACPYPVKKNGRNIASYCCSVDCAIESGIISKEFAIRKGLKW